MTEMGFIHVIIINHCTSLWNTIRHNWVYILIHLFPHLTQYCLPFEAYCSSPCVCPSTQPRQHAENVCQERLHICYCSELNLFSDWKHFRNNYQLSQGACFWNRSKNRQHMFYDRSFHQRKSMTTVMVMIWYAIGNINMLIFPTLAFQNTNIIFNCWVSINPLRLGRKSHCRHLGWYNSM